MSKEIKLVDIGRGLQLANSRITVQLLVPFFQSGCSYEEIRECTDRRITDEEIAFVERYYREHQADLDEEDRQIRARTAQRIEEQRRRYPVFEGTREERLAYFRRLLEQRGKEKTGETTAR